MPNIRRLLRPQPLGVNLKEDVDDMRLDISLVIQLLQVCKTIVQKVDETVEEVVKVRHGWCMGERQVRLQGKTFLDEGEV